ncbi:MAG: right-handed parallel beta-helix repeat-containing protein [Candidatus Eisenbacteria bacterium]
MLRQIAAAVVACLLLAAPALPAVIYVDESGGGDYLTIQEGINAAAHNQDTVLVAPGTYSGPLNRDLDFQMKRITLRGVAGSDSTTIDCQEAGRGFDLWEDWGSVVEGFTVVNGRAFWSPSDDGRGGGMRCDTAFPTIRDVVFQDNEADGGGAALYCYGGGNEVMLSDCLFLGNTTINYGGAVLCVDSSVYLADCQLLGNDAESGGGIAVDGWATLVRCAISGNTAVESGGGAFVSGDATFVDCVFAGNSATGGAGGGVCADGNPDGAVLLLDGCTLYGNSSPNAGALASCFPNSVTVTNSVLAFSDAGGAVECMLGSIPTVAHCCVFGNAGGDSLCGDYHDNIFEDPIFCDAEGGDYMVHADSPCLPEGNPWLETIGAYGQGCGPEVNTWYVDCDNTSGIEDGSEEHPFDTIAEGMAAAGEGNTVLVAPGTYTGPQNQDLDFGGTNMVLRSTAGRDSTLIDCADSGRVFLFQSGEGPSSVVDGFTISNTDPDIVGSGIYCQGSSPTLVNLVLYRTGGLYCDQASPSVAAVDFDTNYWYSGMRCVNNSSPALSGARFAGNFDGGLVCFDSSPTLTDVVFEDHPDWGCAMSCTGSSDAVLTNVTFERNDQGGLYCNGASPTLSHVTFRDNGNGEYPAGGMYCTSGSPILENVTFTGNRGEYAGGMACLSGCSASLTDVTFRGNSGSSAGGMYCKQSSPLITGVDFDGNSGGQGAGIYCFNGAHPVLNDVAVSNSEGTGMRCAHWCNPILTNVVVDSSASRGFSCEDSCDVSLTNVTISGNRDGGMMVSHSSATLTDAIFSGNHSAGDGGGLYCMVADVTLTDVTFEDNSSDARGGGVFATGSWFSGGTMLALDRVTLFGNSAADGGAIFLDEYSAGSMTRSTLSENAAASGAGIHCVSGFGFDITNTIIAFSSQGEGLYCTDPYDPTTTHSCIFGNAGGDSLCGSYYDNMFVDPLFCTGELTLSDDSPCLPENNTWGELVGAHGAGGCGSTPVEGSFYAHATSPESVVLRWTVESLEDIERFDVYRAASSAGPFAKVNAWPIPPTSPGEYEDSTVWPETTFWYELRAFLDDGTEDVVGPSLAEATTAGHLGLVLHPAAPNPFAAATSIHLDVPDHAGPVSLGIYNARGQVVRTLIDRAVERGRHTCLWDGRDDAGRQVSSGIYFARLMVGDRSRGEKLVVLR